MNSILMIFMFMIGCEVPAGILSYQYINFSPSKELYLPDCRMLEQKEAISKLAALDLDVKIVHLPYSSSYEPGTVTHMVPRQFTKIKTNRVVALSIAGYKKNIEVPNLKNLTLRKAKIQLIESEFNLDTVMYEFNSNIREGLVVHQSPKSGTILKSGSDISLFISKGMPEDYFTVPALINLPLKKAKEKISQEGLRIGEITEIYQPKLIPNTVIEQNYPPNLRITAPIKIDLVISKNKK